MAGGSMAAGRQQEAVTSSGQHGSEEESDRK